MFRPVRGGKELLNARQLRQMLRANVLAPQDLVDVLIAGRYRVPIAAVVDAAARATEPMWARYHVREARTESPSPPTSSATLTRVHPASPTARPDTRFVAPQRAAPTATDLTAAQPAPTPRVSTPKDDRVAFGVMGSAPVRSSAVPVAEACQPRSSAHDSQTQPRDTRPPPSARKPRTQLLGEVQPIDFSALWEWKRLRLSPSSQHRALAAGWARSLLGTHQDWLFVDTETTGLSTHDQVIELAIARPVRSSGSWKLDPVLVQRVRPSVPVGTSVLTHGIADSDLRHSPTFREVAEKIRAIMHGKRLLAWNAPFDRAALRRTANSWKTSQVAEDRHWHCAMRAHAVWAGDTGGRMLYRYHKLGGDHSAMGDVQCMLHRIVSMAESAA